MLTLANIGIALGCAAVTIVVLKHSPQFTCVGLATDEDCSNYVDNPVGPAVLVALSALFVSHCFMQVYSMAVSTMLLCFCLDEDKFKSGQYKNKLNDQGEPDGRMFCVVNDKLGLIQLVAPSEMKKQEAKDAEQRRGQGRRRLPEPEPEPEPQP